MILISRTYNRSDRISVSLLRTMLLFGRKYEMRQLQREAVQCLMLEFPSTLQKWSDTGFDDIIDMDSGEITSLIEILYLAHEHSIISILPALYLRICLDYGAVSRVLFGSHIYLNSCIIVSNKLLRDFNVLQRLSKPLAHC
jgi:hypothetical protein